MILSLTVYLFLAIALYVLARGSYEATVHKDGVMLQRVSQFWDWQIIASILLFAVVCGVRYNVGVDNLGYIKQYVYAQEHGTVLRQDFEPLFAWVQMSMANFGFHYSVFNGFWAAIQITFIYYALRNDKKYLPYVALMIVLSPIYLKWMNGVRQCVVECVFFFLIEYIEKKQMWKYMLGVFLCSFIHSTAILLVPMYFIFQKPFYFKRWWVRIAIFLLCTYFGSQTGWFKSMMGVTDILEFIGYDRYADRMEYITTNLHEAKDWGPEKVGLFILDIMAIIIAPTFIKKYKLGKRFDIYYCAFFWGACGFRLFYDLSHLFYRIFAYYYDFYIIVIPISIYYLHKEKRIALFAFMAFLAYFSTFYRSVKCGLTNNLESWELYRFFFTQ
ncbi:MAG: EpsG family protein [Muribaculaceae bacterium]